MKIAIIAAQSINGVIGSKGKIPWQGMLPADLARFKKVTMGYPVIMGRVTHESIGRPLPGRTNIVLSNNPRFSANGCTVVDSLEQGIYTARGTGQYKAFVIGGEKVYEQALPMASEIFLTVVSHHFEGDTRFPVFPLTEWENTVQEDHQPNERNLFSYSFFVFERKA
ncbi:MAG: dihydrofolate reductase [Minisyncoccia bacterium]